MLETNEDNKPKLPLLSTGKPHISYSEWSDWHSCSYRHKLKYIDKIILDSGSIHTIYGQVIHDALEDRINYYRKLVEEVTPASVWIDKFNTDLATFLTENKISDEEKEKTLALAEKFVTTFDWILETVVEWLNKEFESDWEPIEAEVEIYEPLSENEEEGYFKGFIDLIVKTPKYNKDGSKIDGEFIYWILDWKTTDWGWTKYNKASFKKQAQLLCYKNYYSKIKNIPMEDIKCGWILVKRKPKKGELPFELVVVPSTEKKVQEAIFMARQMITSLYRKLYLKNYMECHYCVYRMTDDCRITKKKKQ